MQTSIYACIYIHPHVTSVHPHHTARHNIHTYPTVVGLVAANSRPAVGKHKYHTMPILWRTILYWSISINCPLLSFRLSVCCVAPCFHLHTGPGSSLCLSVSSRGLLNERFQAMISTYGTRAKKKVGVDLKSYFTFSPPIYFMFRRCIYFYLADCTYMLYSTPTSTPALSSRSPVSVPIARTAPATRVRAAPTPVVIAIFTALVVFTTKLSLQA